MADAALSEEFAQRVVVGVGPRAVGHHPPGRDLVGAEPGQGALQECDDGRGLFVGEQLAVGQSRVVIDDGVEVVVTERVIVLLGSAAAVAGDGVPRSPEPRIALDVHVEQIAGTRPLVAPKRFARRARHP